MGHRHRVLQSIAALARSDDNNGKSAGWRFLCRDMDRTLPRARAHGEHHAVNRAGTWHAFAAVIDHRQFTRLRVKALHRVFSNADADRDEGTEAAMYARTELDPLFGRFRSEWRDAAANE